MKNKPLQKTCPIFFQTIVHFFVLKLMNPLDSKSSWSCFNAFSLQIFHESKNWMHKLTSIKRCCFYLQCFIPTASHDTAVVWGLDPVDCFNWAIVLWREIMRNVTWFCFIHVHTVVLGFCSNLCNLDGLIAVEIPHFGCLITGSCEDFASILDRKKEKQIINYSTTRQHLPQRLHFKH